jgi:hypothetical protein
MSGRPQAAERPEVQVVSEVGAAILRLLAGTALLGTTPILPEAYWRLPAEVRDRATVVVSGTYTTGRGPCEWLPHGGRRWRLLAGFVTTTVYRGSVRAKYIGVENPGRVGTEDHQLTLVEGRKYLLLLRPSKDSARMLQKAERGPGYWNVLSKDEIVAVVEP